MRNHLLCGAAALAMSTCVASAASAQAPPALAAPAQAWLTSVYLLQSERRPAAAGQPDPSEIDGRRIAHGTVGWIGRSDIPEDLLARFLGTATVLGIDIDAAGAIVDCTVLRPSVEPRLDALACRLTRERAQVRPFYVGPGKPAASRWTLAIGWQNFRPGIDSGTFEPPPPMPPPPPPPPGAHARGVWPRVGWAGHVVAASLPHIQDQFPAEARRRHGMVSLDLLFTTEAGITDCLVGASSGDRALDEAACRIARGLDLHFVRPCDSCSSAPLPVQVVWNRRGGSHVRLPLMSSRYSADWPEQPRDPADTRSATRRDPYGAIQTFVFAAADFAGVRDRTLQYPFVAADIEVSSEGRIGRCRLQRSTGNPAVDARTCRLILRQTHPVQTDAFGDPLPGRNMVFVDLRAIG